MAQDNVKQFLQRLRQDPELSGRLEKALDEALAKEQAGFASKELIAALKGAFPGTKEEEVLSRPVSEEELAVISGAGNKACSDNYFNRDCAATVEQSSWCASNDSCAVWEVEYSYVCHQAGSYCDYVG